MNADHTNHPDAECTPLKGWRAGLLWFPDPHSPKAQHETDGLLVTGQSADGIVRIQALGPYRELIQRYPDLPALSICTSITRKPM